MLPRRSSWAIIICTLLTAHCSAQQYTPLVASSDSECALLLEGPGRTSAFDYNLNALRGTFGYGGQHTCVTYDAINQAYIQARKRINVAQPKTPIWKTEEIATVGELLLDISINLAKTYGLSYEDIEKGLPLIDTSKTLIREVCPPFLANVECRPGKYRRYDGLCSNLQHPTWGATMTPFTRLVGPLYADGMTAPRISVTGTQLPLPRIVSRTVHPDEGFHDHAGTVMVVAWGQFMDHDYTLTATPLDPLNRNEPEECCNRPAHLKNPYCLEIHIPADDYFYSLFGLRCQDFVRGFPAVRPGCRLGSRAPFNTLTGVLDGNTVYGVSEKFARHLRAGYGGLMRMNPVFTEYGLKDLLPLKLDIPDEGCTRPNRSMYCFEGGEIRVNEQLVLTCMHTLMAREHNRIAHALSQINSHWDDETLYQEARRIVIAEIQHITFNEFLPIILGKEVMEKFGLLTQKEGYWDGYDPNVNPNVIDAFAAAAFRFGHSLLPTAIERWSKAHKFIASRRLSDLIRQPYDLYRAGVLDEYFMGLMNQVAQAMDDSVTQEVTNHLFKKPGARFGMDLASFNMQRGREFGLPGYMEFRKFCGLPDAHSFDELFGSMSNETIRRYASIYEHPSDVDLWSGGVSERPLPGSMVGPTFACIIATQFSYSRRGDRFWYELGNQPSSFTPEQLQEIRKAKLSRVICDNTDLIDTIQVYPMVLPDHEINPRVPCRSGVIPGIDLTKWADFGVQATVPGATPFKQSENIVQAYPTLQQPEQHKRLSQQTFNINTADQNCNFHPASPPNPDVVQSIEVHSYEEQVIAAPSQKTVEDNSVGETVIITNVKDKTLNTNNDDEGKTLKWEVSNEEETDINKPQDEQKQRKTSDSHAHESSSLSNGYVTKIIPSFSLLETMRVPRSVDNHKKLTEDNSKQIQSGSNAENIEFLQLDDSHKGIHTTQNPKNQEEESINHEKTVTQSIPTGSESTETYQVHQMINEEPSQESEVRRKVSTSRNVRYDHNRTKPQHKASKQTDPIRLDRKLGENTMSMTYKAPRNISKDSGNGPSEDVIKNLKLTSAFVQDSDLEVRDGHVRSRAIMSTDPSHKQGQDTSRHGPRRKNDSHGTRANHLLLQNSSNKGESIQDNKRSDLASKINASHTLGKQTENKRALQNSDYVDETHRLNDNDEIEQIKPLIVYNEERGIPLSSIPHSDTSSSSPRSDQSLRYSITGTPESTELHDEAETEGEEKNKDEEQETDYEESVLSSEQNEDEKKSHETLQTKPATLDHNSQNKEQPKYNTEHKDNIETKNEEEDGGIYETISKILQKKDAISRSEAIVGKKDGKSKNEKEAESYRNFWVLEYSRPKFSK